MFFLLLLSLRQVHIVWLRGTELCGEEEALGCLGLVEAEEVPVLEGEVVEDLRGANSVVVEGVEEGGADTFAPSPDKFTWALTAAFCGNIWTSLGVINTVSMETWLDNVVTVMYRFCVDVLCFVTVSCIWRIK